MPPTILLVHMDHAQGYNLCETLHQRRDLRIVGHVPVGAPASARAADLDPDVLVVADTMDSPLLPLIRDLHVASPRSRIIVLGTSQALDSVTIVALTQHGLFSYLVWEDVEAETLAQCATLVVRHALMVGSPAAWEELLAPLERRLGARVAPSQSGAVPERRATDAAITTLHATLWEENPDLTAILQTVFALAGGALDVVNTAAALLAAATRARRGDFLIVDCSLARPDDMSRSAAIVTRALLPVHIIHPRLTFIEEVKAIALGEVIGLAPDMAGLTLLEKLRGLAAMMAPALPGHLPLTARETQIWQLLAERYHDGEIAARLRISPSTVKTNVARIKEKLGLSSRAELIAAYKQLTRG